MHITKITNDGSRWGKEIRLQSLGKGIKRTRPFLLKDIPKYKFNVVNKHIDKRGTTECHCPKQKIVTVFVVVLFHFMIPWV